MVNIRATVWTEGKTDARHLRHFWELAGSTREHGVVDFKEHELGADELVRHCRASKLRMKDHAEIFIFDSDVSFRPEVSGASGGLKDWGNRTYSFCLPIPADRGQESGVCIEHYYTDSELQSKDASGRRLYISTEFNSTSGRHSLHPSLSVGNKGRLKTGSTRILDSDVYDENNSNVAMSKADFVDLLVCEERRFDETDAQRFQPVFLLIQEAIWNSLPEADPFFAGMPHALETTPMEDRLAQFLVYLRGAISMTKLSCMAYATAVIRCYSSRFISEDRQDQRRTKPIKTLIAEEFLQPSLMTLHHLSGLVFHLIDDTAPAEILQLRKMMLDAVPLGPLGVLLEVLDKRFPTRRLKWGRIVNRQALQKPLDFVVSELANHEQHLESLESDESLATIVNGVPFDEWCSALSYLQAILSPLCSLTLQRRKLVALQGSDDLEWTITRLSRGRCYEDTTKNVVPTAELSDLPQSELLIENGSHNMAIDLWPFMIIRERQLYFFSRKSIHGFEYSAPFVSVAHAIETTRSFYRVALGLNTSTDVQSLFWAHVNPSESATRVRANLPFQDPIIGRKQQRRDIIQDVLIIPNQDAILYGPGGVGKTALLLDIARYLTEDPQPEIRFDNVIWISAKRDYYDPVFDNVEPRGQRVSSLESVLTAISEFYGWEAGQSYPPGDLKWLVTESFKEKPTLLIIDNFESIPASDQAEILRFLGTDMKRDLRTAPANCKVLITSRESVPSGFHQIRLRGLDWDDSYDLMKHLYIPYQHSGQPMLTEEQARDLYATTNGVPLLIKHAFGQVFEYGRDLNAITAQLSAANNNAISFSFSEVIKLLKEDPVHVKILIGLEVAGRPLLARHIAEIVGETESSIEVQRDRLVSFHCVFQAATGQYNRYEITDEARLFTRRLAHEYKDVAITLRQRLSRLSASMMSDYSSEELDAHLDYEQYINDRNLLAAETFIRDMLRAYPDSLLLTCDYAKYLHVHKRRTREAIDRLEHLRTKLGNERHIVRGLMVYYSELPQPDFGPASLFANELKETAIEDPAIRADLARFYSAWATALRLVHEPDPTRRIAKTQQYKELGDEVLAVLKGSDCSVHEKHFLMARAHYNRWDYERAEEHINRAISHLPANSVLAETYSGWKREIIKKKNDREWVH